MEEVDTLILEHQNLCKRINKLNAVFNDKLVASNINKEDTVEIINIGLQLKGMRIEEEALKARIINRDVVMDGGLYFKKFEPPVEFEEKSTND